MVEDHRHRVFQHCECERTEEQQRDDEHPADAVAMVEEECQFPHDGVGLAGHDQIEVSVECAQQRCFVDIVGQYDEDQDQQRQYREQRVVSHCACEQVTLVGAKALENPDGEGARVAQDSRCARAKSGHVS